MPQIDVLESKEQDKHENHCVLQKFCWDFLNETVSFWISVLRPNYRNLESRFVNVLPEPLGGSGTSVVEIPLNGPAITKD